MKPDSTDTPPPNAAKQWQGLDEYVGSAEFLEAVQNEFPEGASEFTDEVSRRRFIGLMGASVALATGAGCNLRPAPQRKILPYVVQPDEVTPGVANFYASAATLSGFGEGILVRSREGRPIKVEGNPDHPSSLGGASIFGLAGILDLYDPDRSRGVNHRGYPSSMEQAIDATRQVLYAGEQPKAATRLRILTGTVTSPTLAGQIGKLLADFPQAKWVQHEPAGDRGNIREGTRKAFGKPLNVTYDFVKGDVVLALDCDFLASNPGSLRYSREFADRRKIRKNGKSLKDIHEAKKEEAKKGEPKKEEAKNGHEGHGHTPEHKEGVLPEAVNRLYAVEPMPTCTGSVADHRLAIPGSHIEAFARALAAQLGVPGAPAAGALPAGTAQSWQGWLKPLADDLLAKKGRSIVVAGDHLPASVHALVAAINSHLGNIGKTVLLSAPVEARPEGKVTDLKTLTDELNRKEVDVLLVFGANPVYTAPADIDFGDAIKNAPFSLHLGIQDDETAVKCHWHVNETHYLETWGDVRGHDGTVAIQQPLIAPLHNGKSAIEFLAAVTTRASTGNPLEGDEIVQAYWRNGDEVRKTFPGFKVDKPFPIFWDEAVRAGVVPGTLPTHETPALAGNWAEGAPNLPVPGSGSETEINFRADPTLHDGRFANNGWLHELPKPVTKITWDNAAFMSPATAKKFGVADTYFRWTGGEHGRAEVDIVELKVKVGGKERTVKAPVWVLPGHADGVVTVHLGYGRPRAGKVNTSPGEPNAAGDSVRGFNAYALRGNDAPWFAGGLTVSKAKGTYYLACVQGQTSMTQKDPLINFEWNRKPVRHGDLDLYSKNPKFAKIPPQSAGETDLINENVPEPAGHPDAKEKVPTPGSHATRPETEGHDVHDNRLHPLTMYHDDPGEKFERFAPGLRAAQQRRWAMAVDLNACTGCSACVVACVSENNIPVVGKEQVTKGRLMHWINVDRYYEGSPDDAANLRTLFQPRMCVQCENAPCEIVCPVGATVHSVDGLNDMVYNRCVGTRYCSNNCPYKVRRFNFLTFADWDTNTLKLGRNPEVSVRSRGVMEKCTFCVQRIRGAEIVAEREYANGNRKVLEIRDGEILTACQAACPSGAIMFGDLNDPHSTVCEWKEEPRNYGLLAELNTRPRLTHLAIVRNPNPAMPKGA